MTHFAALIIVPDPDGTIPVDNVEALITEMLAPFDENIVMEPYQKPCYQCNGTGKYAGGHDGTRALPANDEHPEVKPGDPCPAAPGGRYFQADEPDENCIDGKVWSQYNPNSKWDWWVIGGRWPNKLMAHKDAETINPQPTALGGQWDGQRTAGARKRDIDWEGMGVAQSEDAASWWDKAVAQVAEHAFNDPEEAAKMMYWTAGARAGETREEYIQRQVKFSAGAILTGDGVWHEMGRHGWFGTQEDGIGEDAWAKEVKRIVDEAGEHDWFVFCDLHI